ncbi:hypothetical protein BS17DRAFT_831842 [Gyrodon lividus]|nr:hypothetical protein BS17DRAFT_831842 [Gyrodon lividus]
MSSTSSVSSQYFDTPIMHFSSRGDDMTDDQHHKKGPTADEQGPLHHSERAPIDSNPADASVHDRNPRGQGERPSRSYAVRHRPTQSTSPQNMGGKSDFTGSPRLAGQRSPSLRSLPTSSDGKDDRPVTGGAGTYGGRGSTLGRKSSVRTARSTRTTGTTSGAASAFANGAALTGPNAEPEVDESIWFRGLNAERSLSQRQKDRIVKEERKESKKFSKLLKTESTSEKAALDSALKTLAALQNLHKAAIKRGEKAEASHTKALSAAQKAESRFHEEKARAAQGRARAEARCIEERARWEGKEGEARAQKERLESEREIVMEMEERVAESAREVERLRIVKATDEREREAKLIELAGQK